MISNFNISFCLPAELGAVPDTSDSLTHAPQKTTLRKFVPTATTSAQKNATGNRYVISNGTLTVD